MTTLLTPGGKLDASATLTPVRIAVLTISDTRDEESDTSGHVLVERLTGAGHQLADKAIVRDDIAAKTAAAQAVQSKPAQTQSDIDDILTSASERPQAPAKPSTDETPPSGPTKSDVPF